MMSRGRSPFLAIVIDGYNFLKTNGWLADKVGDSGLEKGRRRLIEFLLDRFDVAKGRPELIVVFDSRTTLKLPAQQAVNGIQVLFSNDYASADELIVELVRRYPVPKRMLVVSNDHQIQVTVSRRKATAVDSDQWLDELELDASGFRAGTGPPDQGYEKELFEEAVDWMEWFGELQTESLAEASAETVPAKDDLMPGFSTSPRRTEDSAKDSLADKNEMRDKTFPQELIDQLQREATEGDDPKRSKKP